MRARRAGRRARSSASPTSCSGSGRRSSRARSSSAGTPSGCRPTASRRFPSYQSGRVFDDAAARAARPAARARAARSASAPPRRPATRPTTSSAAAVAQEEERGGQTLVATSDRDAFQLVSRADDVLQPVKGVSELARIGPAEVRERYGVEPAQVPDFIALRGDPSDKLPGARGRRAEDGGGAARRVRLAGGGAGGRTVLGAEGGIAALPANRDDGRLCPSPLPRRPSATMGGGVLTRGVVGPRQPRRRLEALAAA